MIHLHITSNNHTLIQYSFLNSIQITFLLSLHSIKITILHPKLSKLFYPYYLNYIRLSKAPMSLQYSLLPNHQNFESSLNQEYSHLSTKPLKDQSDYLNIITFYHYYHYMLVFFLLISIFCLLLFFH